MSYPPNHLSKKMGDHGSLSSLFSRCISSGRPFGETK